MKERRKYNREYKVEAVRLAEQRGVRAAAESLGVDLSLLYQWKKQLASEGAEAFRGNGNRTAFEQENRQGAAIHWLRAGPSSVTRTRSKRSTKPRTPHLVAIAGVRRINCPAAFPHIFCVRTCHIAETHVDGHRLGALPLAIDWISVLIIGLSRRLLWGIVARLRCGWDKGPRVHQRQLRRWYVDLSHEGRRRQKDRNKTTDRKPGIPHKNIPTTENLYYPITIHGVYASVKRDVPFCLKLHLANQSFSIVLEGYER